LLKLLGRRREESTAEIESETAGSRRRLGFRRFSLRIIVTKVVVTAHPRGKAQFNLSLV